MCACALPIKFPISSTPLQGPNPQLNIIQPWEVLSSSGDWESLCIIIVVHPRKRGRVIGAITHPLSCGAQEALVIPSLSGRFLLYSLGGLIPGIYLHIKYFEHPFFIRFWYQEKVYSTLHCHRPNHTMSSRAPIFIHIQAPQLLRSHSQLRILWPALPSRTHLGFSLQSALWWPSPPHLKQARCKVTPRDPAKCGMTE